MAATRARCIGFKKDGSTPATGEASRLGSGGCMAEAATWHTFAEVRIHPNGSGQFHIRRDGEPTYTVTWGPEGVALQPTEWRRT